ncbi:MAG: choice-of-anchor J domain-containing protein [Bacteroidales bacterium]|nr:choice-of-anchor J domain-containing protein [Bacteroidales bacterium]
MKKYILLFALFLVYISSVYAQTNNETGKYNGKIRYSSSHSNSIPLPAINKSTVFFLEDFEAGVIPDEWTTISGDCNWFVTENGSSTYFSIPDHTTYVCVSDDGCNANMSNVWLITPTINLSGVLQPELSFDVYGYSDLLTIKISNDNGNTFADLQQLSDCYEWTHITIPLSDYAGQTDIKIAFHYNDQGYWGYGYCLDNISIRVQSIDDLSVVFASPVYVSSGDSPFPSVIVKNSGINTQNNFSVDVVITDGTGGEVYSSSALSTEVYLASSEEIEITMPDPWETPELGQYNIKAFVSIPNDEDPTNDTLFALCNVLIISNSYTVDAVDNNFVFMDVPMGNETVYSDFDCSNFPMEMEFAADGNYYLIRSASGDGTVPARLSTYDYITETENVIGELTGIAGIPTAIAYNWATDTMFIVFINEENQPVLGTVDLSTAECDIIGTGTGLIIAMDFDDNDTLYGISIDDDMLYQIDLISGYTDAVGYLYTDINYGQDISFNRQTDVMYGLLFGNNPGLYSINLQTGEATMLAAKTHQYACFEIEEYPPCQQPGEISVVDITTESALLQWENTGSAMGWNAEWGEEGFTQGEGTLESEILDNLFTLSGLSSNTSYSFYLQSICDAGLSSWVGPISFTTLPVCETQNSLVEGFEDGNIPLCWDNIQNGAGNNTWSVTSQSPYSGDYAAFAMFEASGNENQQWLITNSVLIPQNQKLSFYVKDHFSTDNASQLKLFISNDQQTKPLSYIELLAVNESEVSNTEYTHIEADITDFSGQQVCFAFVMIDNNGDSWYIDDISMETNVNANLESPENIRIYPNPCNNEVIIMNAQGASIELINLTGQTVLSFDKEYNNTHYNLESLSAGNYFVRITKNNTTVVKKLSIIR